MSEDSPTASQSPTGAFEVRVGVCRLEGVDEPDALSWERHNARRAVLEEEFGADAFVVADWGDTKDEEETHEFVELLVLVTSSEVQEFAWDGMKWIAEEIGKSAVSAVVSGVIGGVVAKLLPRQKKKEIARFHVGVGDTAVSISPKEEGGDQRLWLPGKVYFDNVEFKPPSWRGPDAQPRVDDNA